MKKQINIDDYHYSHKANTLLLVCLFLVTLMLALVMAQSQSYIR